MSNHASSEPNLELVAIDLDGTLVDSVGDLLVAINAMQKTMTLPLSTEADVRMWIGNGIERLVHRALTNSMEDNAAPSLFEPSFAHFTNAYDKCNGHHSELYAGVAEGLAWLAEKRIPLVCVTNKARRFAAPLLDHHKIAHYFEHLIAGDDVSAKKPNPMALLTAANKCGAQPARSALIGDSISDIKAARAANFNCICVSYGYNHGINIREPFDGVQADAVIDSFTELKYYLPAFAVGRP